MSSVFQIIVWDVATVTGGRSQEGRGEVWYKTNVTKYKFAVNLYVLCIWSDPSSETFIAFLGYESRRLDFSLRFLSSSKAASFHPHHIASLPIFVCLQLNFKNEIPELERWLSG